MLDAEVVEVTQRLAGEVADLRVVPLALEFGDDDHREHHGMLREAEERLRIAQQDRGVEDVGAQILIGFCGRGLSRRLTGGLLRGAGGLLR